MKPFKKREKEVLEEIKKRQQEQVKLFEQLLRRSKKSTKGLDK